MSRAGGAMRLVGRGRLDGLGRLVGRGGPCGPRGRGGLVSLGRLVGLFDLVGHAGRAGLVLIGCAAVFGASQIVFGDGATTGSGGSGAYGASAGFRAGSPARSEAGSEEPGAAPKEAAQKAVSATPTVRVDHLEGATRIAAVLPGPVKAYAFPAVRAGARTIALLVDTTPRTSSAGGLEVIRTLDTGRKTGSRNRKKNAKEGTTRVRISVGSGGADVSVDSAPVRNGTTGSAAGAPGIPGAQGIGTSALAWLETPGPGRPCRIEMVQRDLPGDVQALDAVDVDGDGDDDIVMWRPGSLEALALRDGAERVNRPRTLVSDPEIQPASSAARAVCDLDCGADRRLWTTIVGSLRAYGPLDGRVTGVAARGGARPAAASERASRESDDGSATSAALASAASPRPWGIVEELALPVSVSRERSGLRLASGTVRSLPAGPGPPSGAVRTLYVGPEPFGTDRLRTLIIDPSLPADRNTSESWALLPGLEKTVESAYLQIDGKNALVVTTRSAEKLALFAEKRLRLFFLEPDRTRRGLPPVLAVETRINLWQAASILASDVDRDGRQDLVIGYWKGLKNHHMVLDAYVRNADGSFSTSARTTTFEVKDADRSFLSYGHDLDGDGAPELVLLAEGRLLVYPGTAGRKGRDLVGDAPRWRFPLAPEGEIHVNMPAGGSGSDEDPDFDPDPAIDEAQAISDARNVAKPRFIDLDGDGRDEIFLSGSSLLGGNHFQVFLFPGGKN